MKWIKRIKLNEDPCLPNQDLQARNYLLACFAVSLIEGDTIQSRTIRHTTVRNYVNVTIASHIDRELSLLMHATVNYIDIVLKALKKYETMSDRREIIYDEMIHHLEKT